MVFVLRTLICRGLGSQIPGFGDRPACEQTVWVMHLSVCFRGQGPFTTWRMGFPVGLCPTLILKFQPDCGSHRFSQLNLGHAKKGKHLLEARLVTDDNSRFQPELRIHAGPRIHQEIFANSEHTAPLKRCLIYPDVLGVAGRPLTQWVESETTIVLVRILDYKARSTNFQWVFQGYRL